MAYVTIETTDGPKRVKVCDYCRASCCQTRYCSGRCARQAAEREQFKRKPQSTNPKE